MLDENQLQLLDLAKRFTPAKSRSQLIRFALDEYLVDIKKHLMDQRRLDLQKIGDSSIPDLTDFDL